MNLMFAFAFIYASTIIGLSFELNKIIIMGIAVILAAILVSNKTAVLKCIFCAMLLAFVCFNGYNYLNDTSEFYSKTLEFSGTILENPNNYDDYSRVLVKVKVENKSIKTYLYLDDPDFRGEVSDEITGTAYFYQPSNKNGFNSINYYKSDGISVLGSVDSYEVIENNNFTFRAFTNKINEQISQIIDNYFVGDYAGFLKGLILGDKTDFSSQFKLDISKAGISHILVVSGLHIGYLVSASFLVFGKKYGNFVALIVIAIFFVIIGYSPSILRACIMNVILICGNLFAEKYSSKISIWVAFVAVLIINPYSYLDIGFILSFASSGGIIYFYSEIYDKVKTKFKYFNKFVVSSFCVSIAVSVATTVPLIIYFDAISSVSLLSNMVVLPFIPPIFIFTALCVMLSFTPIGEILVYPIVFLIDIVMFFVERLSSFKFSQIPTDSEILLLVAIIILVLFLISYAFKKLFIVTLPLCVIMYFSALYYVGYTEYNTLITTIFPVYDGQAVLVTYQDEVTLIDCGSSKYTDAGEQITEHLYTFGYDKIDNFIVTSIDSTHTRDVFSIDFPISNIIIPESYIRLDAYEYLESFINQNSIKSYDNLPEYIEVIVKDEKKIAVLINNEILTLHSFTNIMIDEFLQEHKIEAHTIILADKVIGDYKKLEEQLETMKIEQVILSNDYDLLSRVSGVPAKTTIEYGTIKLRG